MADLADQLIAKAKDANTTTEYLDELIEAHASCQSGKTCELCEYIDEELFTTVYIALSENTSLSPDRQMKVFNIGSDWQGCVVSLILNFARNPSICDELKDVVLSARDFVGVHVDDDIDDYMATLRDAAEENPRFSKHEIDQLAE